jgi:uncharacterized protein (DUF362 family)
VKARAFLGRVNSDGSDYLERIRAGLDFVRFGEGLPAQPRVFIKPNLTFPSYRPGVMTSPEAVEAAIVALQDYTPHIWVGDSDSGGYNPFAMEDVYAETGINQFAARHGVQVVNLSGLERVGISFRGRGREMQLDLPRLLVEEIDVLVTMPVPKVHTNTGVSLTFKNQWGCIPEPNDRLRLHPFFKETVVAVNQAVKAKYAIIDGRFGLNRSGPMKGDEVRLGWLAVTDDIGAGARMACELMQVELESIAHLRYARSLGLVPALADIECSDSLEGYLGPRFYMKRIPTDYPGLLAFRSRGLAHLAYFSRLAGPLHRILYRFREPFYDYSKGR